MVSGFIGGRWYLYGGGGSGGGGGRGGGGICMREMGHRGGPHGRAGMLDDWCVVYWGLLSTCMMQVTCPLLTAQPGSQLTN